jgi:hypothetical protein
LLGQTRIRRTRRTPPLAVLSLLLRQPIVLGFRPHTASALVLILFSDAAVYALACAAGIREKRNEVRVFLPAFRYVPTRHASPPGDRPDAKAIDPARLANARA